MVMTLDKDTSPVEANLKWAISKSRIETDFIGSEVLKNQFQRWSKKIESWHKTRQQE